MTDHVQISDSGGVRTIVMNRPEKRNALTNAMYGALADGLLSAQDDAAIGAAVIAANGSMFTAGNDIADFMQQAGDMAGREVWRFLRGLATFEKPLVAAVNGAAIGVGTTMLFHCDLVYAAPGAYFAMPFVDLGLVPEAGSSLLAPRLLGNVRAAAMLLLGERLDAEGAVRGGIANAVVAQGDLLDHACAQAVKLASKPREAMRISKSLLHPNRDEILAAIEREGDLFAERLRSDEAKAAFLAFMARSKAPVAAR